MLKSIKSSWVNLWQFVIRPIEQRDAQKNTRHKIGQLFSILLLDIAVMLFLIAIISIVEDYGLINMENHKGVDLMKSNPILGLVSGVIIAPIFEELFFRSYIVKRYSPIHPIVFLSDALGIYTKDRLYPVLENYWDKYFNYVVYFSAILFALVHIFNYEITRNVILLTPLLVLPQFVIGLMLAYFRVKFGLVWSVYFHALHNLVLIGPTVLILA